MDGLRERDPDRRGGEPGLEGRPPVHHPPVELVEIVERLRPREGPGVRRRVLEEEDPPRPIAPVDGGAVHEARVVDGDAARGGGERDRAREVDRGAFEVDAAAERPVRVVVVDRAAVAPGEHHHRAVPVVHVVEEDADREHVVVRVRVEGPVLMPFDGRAVARRLEVHLAPRPHPDVAPDEGLQSGHDRRVSGQVPVEGMGEVGALDAAHARALRGVRGLEVEHPGVARQAVRGRRCLVRHPPELREGVRVQEALGDDVALAPVVLDLFEGQHPVNVFRARSPFPPSRPCAGSGRAASARTGPRAWRRTVPSIPSYYRAARSPAGGDGSAPTIPIPVSSPPALAGIAVRTT